MNCRDSRSSLSDEGWDLVADKAQGYYMMNCRGWREGSLGARFCPCPRRRDIVILKLLAWNVQRETLAGCDTLCPCVSSSSCHPPRLMVTSPLLPLRLLSTRRVEAFDPSHSYKCRARWTADTLYIAHSPRAPAIMQFIFRTFALFTLIACARAAALPASESATCLAGGRSCINAIDCCSKKCGFFLPNNHTLVCAL
ncbi:hypothetical protein LshimejAT787_0100460 [Lyophyllum shimeji]|uniref:Uncharacterized protein n=1 Tax=Lyophyllum shimeji TaxID=47721 RepID=A0A9P3UJC4_LYOSH|nr:hypothetical protein LshimejAT787_0100460 [Lyophyllum shimeji]